MGQLQHQQSTQNSRLWMILWDGPDDKVWSKERPRLDFLRMVSSMLKYSALVGAIAGRGGGVGGDTSFKQFSSCYQAVFSGSATISGGYFTPLKKSCIPADSSVTLKPLKYNGLSVLTHPTRATVPVSIDR